MTPRPARRLAVAMILLLTWAVPARAEEGVDANQALFEIALRAAERGDYDGAVGILGPLSDKTGAPRVRLELARVLFLAGQYRPARREFDRVYRQDLPYPVRRTVNVFLDDIDQRIGYVRPTVGLAYDSNPTGAARSGVYDILGTPLSYTSDARPSAALTWRVDALAPLARRGAEQWQLLAAADGTAFEDAGANRYGAEAGVRYVRLDRRAYATLGWRGTQSAAQRTSSPYVGYERRLTPARDRQINLAASVEINRFPGQPYLHGQTGRASALYARDLRPNTTGIVAVGGSVSSISDPQWPKRTAFGELRLMQSVPRANLNIIAGVSGLAAGYDGRDLFFGKQRRDRSGRVELAVYHGRPVFGLFPGVVASYEVRRSNIDFYGYQRAGLSMDFRRRF